MAETLLDKAITNYNVALTLYDSMGDDEAFLNAIGYHLQQSVEMAVKYLLDDNGIKFPWTHDIDQLIIVANKNNVDLMMPDYISDHSEMFSLWESKTRYVLDYHLEASKVEKALHGVNDYLNIVIEHEQEKTNHDEEHETYTEEVDDMSESNIPEDPYFYDEEL